MIVLDGSSDEEAAEITECVHGGKLCRTCAAKQRDKTAAGPAADEGD
jgi:hypothetical protein